MPQYADPGCESQAWRVPTVSASVEREESETSPAGVLTV
jgi:hypothetical protein